MQLSWALHLPWGPPQVVLRLSPEGPTREGFASKFTVGRIQSLVTAGLGPLGFLLAFGRRLPSVPPPTVLSHLAVCFAQACKPERQQRESDKVEAVLLGT